jgi:hypothetical protein
VIYGTVRAAEDANDVIVRGTLSGVVEVGRNLLGTLEVTKAIDRPSAEPAILIRQDLVGQVKVGVSDPNDTDLVGHIEVRGNVARTAAGRAIHLRTLQPGGQIRVHGSLLANPESTPEIHVEVAMAPSSAIAINWDGYEGGDDQWAEGAAIVVGDLNEPNNWYFGNTPAARIVDVTCVKGDMDNSCDPRDPNTWRPDYGDINPFLLALSNPSAYDAAYPALAGSRVYHADCSCDGDVTFDDIDPFTARLFGEIPWCETCAWGDGPAGPATPLDSVVVAELYRTYLAPENLPAFVQGVRALIARYAGTPRGEFWSDVLARLE